MARRNPPKKIYKKKAAKGRSAESRTISFFIGVVTVALIALAILGLAQGKNYKQVLGNHTTIENSSGN